MFQQFNRLFKKHQFLIYKKAITPNRIKCIQQCQKHLEENMIFQNGGFNFFVLASLFIFNKDDPQNQATKEENADIFKLLSNAKEMKLKRKNLEKIEFVYIQALHIALSRRNKTIIAYVQDQLANLMLQANKLDEAQELFQNVAINLVATGVPENHCSLLEISLKLAMISAHKENHDHAKICYTWACEESRKNLIAMEKEGIKKTSKEYENQYALLGMILDSYGRYLYAHNQVKEALNVTKEAFHISTEIFGKEDVRTLVLQNDLSIIHSEIGEIDQAYELAKTCVKIAELNINSAEFSDLATFYTTLASLHIKKKKPKEAELNFKKAIAYAIKSGDKELEQRVYSVIQKFTETEKDNKQQ